jgi:perosamine synthetase
MQEATIQPKFPVYKPLIGEKEQELVNECMQTGWISSRGKYVEQFEETLASYLQPEEEARGRAIATSNGTVALHLAMLALGIGAGDEVIAPSFTYIATTNCIEYVGAKTVFCDVDPLTWNARTEDIEGLINQKTKAVICVHLYGNPCKVDELRKLCDSKGLFLIEDCAESLGATWKNQQTGTFGHISTFSFFGNKTLTTGEGGAIYTPIDSIYDRAVRIKSQGLAKHREYWHDIVGYNFRMTNIAAAIGIGQFTRLEYILERKRDIDSMYRKILNGAVEFQQFDQESQSSCWMTSVLTKSESTRDSARRQLQEDGIETRPTFFPVHTMPMHSREYHWLPNTENVATRGINLPSYPELTHSDIRLIAEKVMSATSNP